MCKTKNQVDTLIDELIEFSFKLISTQESYNSS